VAKRIKRLVATFLGVSALLSTKRGQVSGFITVRNRGKAETCAHARSGGVWLSGLPGPGPRVLRGWADGVRALPGGGDRHLGRPQVGTEHLVADPRRGHTARQQGCAHVSHERQRPHMKTSTSSGSDTSDRSMRPFRERWSSESTVSYQA
jgi:hypothetical protein